ncbi:hypothetical protein BFP76_01810 [Amylibacter kogurei]|uniref:YjiS-like domain-containing protein n=1 Tax=Paramylibacter kogurei TaxID=1889778 RepID=A0A2G5K3C7_9RHOB|nr:DUF1127 domain-containing protein [Amylibacter kogurei]PIB24011.1 hypothetical protein BFP76_01810 [Amylibacter kogurei]
MAIHSPVKTAPFGAISVFRAINVLDNVRSTVATWYARRLTAKELSRLSDRELTDIGLCYGDISTVCQKIKM